MKLIPAFIETPEMKKIREEACKNCNDNCSECSIHLLKNKRLGVKHNG